MDGGIDLAVKIFVQGRIQNLIVLEVEDTPCLFFIGDKWICSNTYCWFVTA